MEQNKYSIIFFSAQPLFPACAEILSPTASLSVSRRTLGLPERGCRYPWILQFCSASGHILSVNPIRFTSCFLRILVISRFGSMVDSPFPACDSAFHFFFCYFIPDNQILQIISGCADILQQDFAWGLISPARVNQCTDFLANQIRIGSCIRQICRIGLRGNNIVFPYSFRRPVDIRPWRNGDFAQVRDYPKKRCEILAGWCKQIADTQGIDANQYYRYDLHLTAYLP